MKTTQLNNMISNIIQNWGVDTTKMLYGDSDTPLDKKAKENYRQLNGSDDGYDDVVIFNPETGHFEL